MQSINIVIQNPIFFLSFMGPLVLLPLATWLTWGDDSVQTWLLLSASVIYFVGPFGITAGGNVPLNEKLAGAQEKDYSAARAAFEKPWNRLHTVRTLGGVIATALVFAACLQ